jgi:hypothetical protein
MRGGPWLLAMLFALGAIAVSLERLRRVHRAVTFDLGKLAGALGRTGDIERVRHARELMVEQEGETWESELVRAALEALSPAERTALVNEQLGDVESALGWGNRIPVAAARLAALGPMSVLFFALAEGSVEIGDVIPLIAWGGAGVVGSLAIGREADRSAGEMRKGIDVWVSRVLDAAHTSVPPSDGRTSSPIH